MPSSEHRGRLAPRLGLVLALVSIAWLYAPTLGFGFVMFDDDVNLYGNPHIGELTWDRFVWAWTGHDYMPRVMPLAWLAVMAIFGAAGMDPLAFHAYNLALHLANTVLVFAVAGLALRLAARSRGRTEDPLWRSSLALFAAAGWGLHPLRSESIAWATGWIYPTVAFFALCAAWLALSRHEHEGPRRRWRYCAAVAAFVASALVYPVTLGFPVALLAFEWWLARGPGWRGGVDWSRLAREQAPFFLVAALVLGANIWTRVWKNRFYPPAPSIHEFTLENRVAQALTIVPYYGLRQAWPGETTPVRDLRPPARLADGRVLLFALGLLAAATAAVACGRRRPGGIAFLVAYLGVAAPFSGFFDHPFQPSDRYGYFPSAVVLVAVGLALSGMGPRRCRGVMLVGLFAWVAWLAAAVPRQLPKWRDSEALFAHLRENLGTAGGRAAYGVSLARSRVRRGDFDGARSLFAELERSGVDPAVLAEQREWSAGMERIARAPAAIPSSDGAAAPDAIQAYRFALRDARAGEHRGAGFRFRQALAVDPDFHDARHDFAVWLAGRGHAAEARREQEELRRRAGTAFRPELDEALDALVDRAGAMREGGS